MASDPKHGKELFTNNYRFSTSTNEILIYERTKDDFGNTFYKKIKSVVPPHKLGGDPCIYSALYEVISKFHNEQGD